MNERVESEVAVPGVMIINASWAGTGLYGALAVVGTAVPDWFAVPTAAVSGALFAIGCVVFLWAYAVAVGRSRTDAIGIGGLYFLADSAPPVPRFRLRLSFAIEVALATVSSSIRPFTPIAFGFLVPVFGLGMMGLWGARYGSFGPRAVREPRTQRDDDAAGDERGGDDVASP